METKKLYRSEDNKVIAGVCGGLGKYAGIDPVIFRLILILVFAFIGFTSNPFYSFLSGIIAYFLAVIIIPKKSENKK